MSINIPNIQDLTVVQDQILNAKKNAIIVMGAPGTGKTILAIIMINKLLEGKSNPSGIKFVVYNKTLCMDIENIFGSKISVRSVYSWLFCELRDFLKKVKKLNLDYEKLIIEIDKRYKNGNSTGDEDNYDYDWEKVKKAFEERYLSSKPFKHFFIDEAQDLAPELLDIIKQYSEKIYIFFDNNQRISSNNCMDVISYLDSEEDFYDLVVNFRNTKEIESVIKLFDPSLVLNGVTLPSITAKSNGEKPVILDAKGEYDGLCKKIIDMQKKNSSESIAILIPEFESSKNNQYEGERVIGSIKETFYKIDPTIKINIYFRSDNQDNYKKEALKNPGGIYLQTYKTAKGMEFDNVFLVELNNHFLKFNSDSAKKGFYVAMSRAKKRLFFVYDGNLSNNEILDKLFEHKNLIDEDQICSVNIVDELFT